MDKDTFKLTVPVKEQAVEFLSNFGETIDEYKSNFPNSKFGITYLSAIYSPYRDVDKLFEILKVYLYQT